MTLHAFTASGLQVTSSEAARHQPEALHSAPRRRFAAGRLAPVALAISLLPGLLSPWQAALAQNPAPNPLLGAPAPTAPAASGGSSGQMAEMPLPSGRTGDPLILNFVNAEIEAVSRTIGTMLNRQILVDPRVKGAITINSEKPLPPAEAWRSYLAALRGLGFTVVENAGLLKVVPEAEAKVQSGTVSAGAPTQRGDQVLTQIFRLNHENPNNLVAVLRPLITANNTINANPGNNTLIITDYADNLQRMAKIIAALDQPAATDIEVVPLQHAMAADLAPLLQRLAEAGGAQTPGGQGGVTVAAESRSNSLIVRAPNQARLAATLAMIAKLDRPMPSGGPAGQIWVVHLKNADALKLAEVLRAAIGAGAGSSGGSGGLSALTGAAAAQTAARVQNSAQAGATTSAAATTPVAASLSPSTGGMIQADPATNSLIITAPESVYRQMRQVIEQLDTRRAQVYVESMIVKVDAEKAAEFGVQWQGLLGSLQNNGAAVVGTNFGSTGNLANLSLSAAGVAGTNSSVTLGKGLNFGVLNKIGGTWTLGALAHVLQTQTGANILSTPNLVALDNEEAKIVIGQNVPFVTGSFTNTGTGNGAVNPFQTVERKDVGITLRIRSQIGEGGTVRMTVFQESSSLRADGTSITDKSSIETTVVVDDGQTMVLGGLLKDEYGDNVDKVPGLGDVPFVGALFRNEGRKRIKSNLMLFLRPVIIRSGEAGDQLSASRYEQIRAAQMQSQPGQRALMPETGAPLLPALPGGAVVMPTTAVPNSAAAAKVPAIQIAPKPAPNPAPATPPAAVPSAVIPAPVPQARPLEPRPAGDASDGQSASSVPPGYRQPN